MRLPRLEFILTKDQLWLKIGDGLELRVKKEDSAEKVIPAETQTPPECHSKFLQ